MAQDALIEDEVRYTVEGHIARILIDRPERRNALSSSVVARLLDLVARVEIEDEVRVLVIQGAGGKAFSAGRDLKESKDGAAPLSRKHEPMRGVSRNHLEALYELPKPTIAAIDGVAIGAGFELAMACDLRVATDRSTFRMPEATFGSGAKFGSVVLPRLIPIGVAKDMLMTGRTMTAQEAHGFGLVNRLFTPAQFASGVADYIDSVVRNAPLSLQRIKEMTTRGLDMAVHAALRLDVRPNPYQSEDRVEGVRALVEGDRPRWQGK